MRQETLSRIVDAHRYSSFYQGDLSNHLPMALTALDGLGASGAQVAAFAARYEKKLEPLPEAEALLAAGIRRELEQDGEQAVLERRLERLLPGVCSIAFHGLVRTAYAVESGSRSELAQALAHWELGYQALGPLPEASGTLTPAQALAGVNGKRQTGGRIASRMDRAAAAPGFSALVASAGGLDLSLLSQALIEAYAATGDFTLLHGITACDAFAVLAPYMRDEGLALRYLWQALACAYASVGGASANRPVKRDDSLSWEEIERRACEATDEHDVKLAYSCRRQHRRYGGELYRQVASAALSRRVLS
ncbi:MAG: questin oxidase family protein [Elusimicrobiota bacterium]